MSKQYHFHGELIMKNMPGTVISKQIVKYIRIFYAVSLYFDKPMLGAIFDGSMSCAVVEMET